MELYRLVKEPYHEAPYDPLSVVGSMTNGGGRWNPPHIGVLYTATSPALALVETMAHFPNAAYAQLPNLHLVTVQVPDDQEAIFWVDPLFLPTHWRTGTLAETQSVFIDWMESPFSLALAVPSAIIDVSYNLLLHPAHPLHKHVKLLHQSKLLFDQRLWRYVAPTP